MNKLLKIFLYITGIIVIIRVFHGLLDDTKTEIISDKAIAALKDPVKKKKIETAFYRAEEEQRLAGVYNSPELNLD